MKLLSKQEVYSVGKRQHDDLVEKNNRLVSFLDKGIKKLNTLKDDYSKDKQRKLKEFEDFCGEIMKKKSGLLQELKELEKLIEEKKELYYSLVDKQDELEERAEEINLKNQKLKTREQFLIKSEERFEAKYNKLLK